MSEFVAETLARWLTAALAEITEEGGYHQTLRVTRPEQAFIDGQPLNDLSAIVVQNACVADSEPVIGNPPQFFWRQTFEVHVLLAGAAGAAVPVDQRINRIVGDVIQRIGLERVAGLAADVYCDGRAYDIVCGPPAIGVIPQEKLTEVSIPVEIAFTFNPNDVYG